MRSNPSRWLGIPVLLGVALTVLGLATLAQVLRPATTDLDPSQTPLQMGLACEADEDPRDQPGDVPLVRSVTLVTCPDAFDGMVVRVRGEAIGDLVGRGERRWVLVNDDEYATYGPLELHGQSRGTNTGIAVLLPEGQHVPNLGGPGTWGSRLEVVGTFRRAAVEDQGGPAVLADAVTVTAPGGQFEAQPLGGLVWVTIAVALGAAAVWAAVLHRRRVLYRR